MSEPTYDPAMPLGENIRRRRIALKWSQGRLAKQAGVSQPVIAELESGKQQTTRFLHEIAVALGTTMAQLDPRPLPAGPLNAEAAADGELIPIYNIQYVKNGVTRTVMLDKPADYIERPSTLMHVRGAYGFMPIGTAMVPEFVPGDIVLVNPALPLIIGVTAVAYGPLVHGFTSVRWGHIIDIHTDSVTLKQWNPREGEKSGIVLDKKEWTRFHRVAVRILAR